MGNSERFNAFFTLLVHPSPQVLRISGINSRKRQLGCFITTEDDISVQILRHPARGSVFIGNKRGKFSGVVVPIGRIDNIIPCILEHLLIQYLEPAFSLQKLQYFLKLSPPARRIRQLTHAHCHFML